MTAEPEKSIAELDRGSADVAIAYSYELSPRLPSATVERRELLTDQVVAALPAAEPAAASPGPVRLDTLAEADWVAPHPATTCHQMMECACGGAGFVPHEVANCTDFPQMLALVGAGVGVALVPRLAAHQLPDGVVIRQIAPPTARDIFADPAGRRPPSGGACRARPSRRGGQGGGSMSFAPRRPGAADVRAGAPVKATNAAIAEAARSSRGVRK
jgi:DNA-binding transcriptional LysR family regulator